MQQLSLALTGAAFGLSLIVAIGAQNAFVLRQGLRREHVGPVVAICAGSDALLIVAGTAGFGALLARFPGLLDGVRYAGAAFVLAYGALALRRALAPGALSAAGGPAPSRRGVLLTCLALTWLNPHVYLDTVVLLGSLASTHGGSGRWVFAAGAATASLVWFTALGFGVRALSGVLARPAAWRAIDLLVAATMAVIGVRLLVG